ncbi:hypothetical protein [Rhizobium sp. MHM7A]|uniref:hypothetical protein n=1 Tax=Rhizobium sp. MHM7A TaxID=2583233 RepID=UPI0012716EF2|nr:hypothetical protein [Rhizobium sp. MHM7A]TLX05680.1 hypothetical protein FFR93_33890 [Rhizobium sp. MHM7A]
MSLRTAVSSSRQIDMDDALEVAPRLEILRQLYVRNRRVFTENSMVRFFSEITAIQESASFRQFAQNPVVIREHIRSSTGARERQEPVRTTFAGALVLLRDRVRNAVQIDADQEQLALGEPRELRIPDKRTIERLSELVPEQKLAPVQFKIQEAFLTVDHLPATTSKQDTKSAESAREALVSQGKTVVEELRRSNCDTRFLETVISLQSKLQAADDIIQLGIMNISCVEMAKKYDAELSDAVSARLRAHLNSVNAYVAQFPDWRRYTENAAVVELDESDIKKSVAIADEIISSLSAEPDLVDAEVPRTIKLIKEAVGDPKRAFKRTSYALFRTLENLFSKVFEYVAQFASDFATQTSTRLAKWGSRTAAGGLITLMLGWAGALTPIYERLPDAEWLKPAITILRSFVF